MDLRTVADWVIRPRLLKEQGVAEVLVIGGDRKQYQVLVDPDRLIEFGVSLQDVDRAIQENNLNASGGFTEEGQVERPVRVIGRLGPDPAKVLDDLRKVPVKANTDRSVLLGQVARVEEGPAPRRGDAGVDGHAAVVITIVKQPHADTVAVTNRVKAALRESEAALPADLTVQTELFQLKDFIDRGIYFVQQGIDHRNDVILARLRLRNFLVSLCQAGLRPPPPPISLSSFIIYTICLFLHLMVYAWGGCSPTPPRDLSMHSL